jgi:iron complex transport system permease protein
MKMAEDIRQKTNNVLARNARLYLTKRRAAIVILALGAALTIAFAAALAIGSEPVALSKIFASLWAKVTSAPLPLSREQEVIVFGLRLPRVALALAMGAALATAGAVFQALLRNPLADPYVLGVSSGAALGSIIGVIFFSHMAAARPLLGFAGAAATTLIVYRFGRRDSDPARLLLAGIVMTTFLSSIIVLLTSMADALRLRNISLWLLGDLSSGSTEGLALMSAAVLIGAAVLMTQARALNLMMIGERDAFALGVETARVRIIVFFTASLLTGVAVSAGGAIGYVGLVVPHLVRLASGADNRLVIPASAMAGALLVLSADTVARTVLAPRELPTGAITALIGAPVFVYLLLKSRG